MKKILLSFSLLYFFTSYVEAQPSLLTNIYYGNYVTPQDSAYRMGWGMTTKIKPGYLAFGYNNAINNSTNSFFSARNFNVTGYGNSFMWKGYDVYDTYNCSGTFNRVTNCYGITAVEVKGLNNVRYIMAGSYDKAAFITAIDTLGGVLYSVSYPYPLSNGANLPYPSKPLIVSSDTPHQYYICGTFEDNVYILNIDESGIILWSQVYHSGSLVKPKAVMMDPYNVNQLLIVGGVVSPTNEKDAFFMRVDGNSGNVSSFKLYGAKQSDEEFRSISESSAINVNNGNGYVISGYAQDITGGNKGTAWVTKLDMVGNTVWSRLIIPSIGTNTGAVDILQRYNTLNQYEHYALIECSAGMQVAKLDDVGIPFQHYNPSGPNNEFVYNIFSNVTRPLKLGFVNNNMNAGNFTGLQVYGHMIGYLIYMQVNASVIMSAYFNGETNCFASYSKLSHYLEGPGALNEEVELSKTNALSSCSNFLVIGSYNGIIAAYNCGNVIPSGSNQRTTGTGELLNNVVENKKPYVYPNPVNTKTNINYHSQDNSLVKIDMFDINGKHILSIEPKAKPEGNYSEEIDFSSLEIESGVYFLTISVDGTLYKEKVVYNK